MDNEFILELIGALDKNKSKKQINSDLKQLQSTINMLKITGTFAKGDTKNELNSYVKSLQSKLNYVKLKGKFDSKNLKNEVDNALHNVSFKDIDLLDVDENKVRLKVRKVIADTKALVGKNSISIDMKREKLSNDLTAYLNKNTKIKESSVLLEEADKLKALIDSIDDPKSLKEATTAFQLYKSEVSATGFAAKSTTDKIKGMLAHITKIGSFFGVASLAVNSFRKSLQTLKEVDTYLTEISKANDKLSKSQLAQIGNNSFAIANKYGKSATNYLSAIQETSRAGYENAEGIAELSVAAQSAGNMTQELANQYIIATDKAYKLGGSVEKLTEVLDGSNFITNHNAVNMTELAEGMSIVGSQAASLGVQVNQTTAVLGTMIATTQQSGSEMARAYRAILLNLQQVTDEEEGITAEGLNKYEAACKALNVSLKETKNGITSLRNPMEVIKDIAEEYSKLDANDIRRTNLLSSVGGKLRANALNAILENYDMYEKMLKEYADGTGSMAAEAEKTANSWAGRLASLQNSWDSFVNSLTNKDAIMGGISFFDKLIQSAEKLTDVFGEIPILLMAINAGIVAMNKDAGITQLINPETKKVDIQGNFMGIDITAIKAQAKHFAEAEKAISGWNSKLLQGQVDINDFGEALVQNNAQLKAYLATTSKDAPASLNGYKSYLNEAGIATDVLRVKTILLNAAMSFGIGLAIQAVVKVVDNYIHRIDKARERTGELFEEFKDLNNTLADHKKTVAELADRYDELANGVNLSNNKNKTLSTDEYEEFLKINKQLADSFPSLSKGIDENGNSILSLGTKGITAKEQLEELLKTEEDLNNFRISESIDEAFAGVLTYVKEAERASENLKNSLSETNKEIGALQEYLNNGIHLNQDHYLLFEVDLTDKTKTDYMFAMQSAANEFYDSLNQDRKLELRSHEIFGASNLLFQSEWGGEVEGFYANLLQLTPDEIEQLEKIIEDNVGHLNGVLSDQFDSQRQGFQEQIYQAKNKWTDFLPYYISAMKSKSTFKKLDSDMQDIAVKIVEGLDYSLTNEFEKYDPTDSYSYIRDKLIVPLGDLSEDNKQLVKDNFNELFTLDSDDISQNNQEQIDQIIKDIAAILEKDPIEIRAILGFDVDISEAQKNYQESLDRAKRKFSGYEYDDRGFQTNISNDLGKVVDEFYEANVKTQDDIALWEKVTENIYDATEAMEAYIEAKNQSSDANETPVSFSDIFSLEDAENTITNLGKISESIDTIQNAYKTLSDAIDEYNETGSLSIDTLQSVIALGDDWLDYLVDENGNLQLDKEALEQLTQARINDMRVQTINNLIDNVSKIETDADANEYLASTNYALVDSYEEVAQAALKSARAKLEDAVASETLSRSNMDAIMEKATADISKINKLFANVDFGSDSIKGSKSSGSKSSSSSSKSEFKETFDFFERRVNVLSDALSLLETNLDNVTGSFAKNYLIDAELGLTEEKFKNYSDALNMYTQKANEALSKLPSDIAQKVRDGAVALTDFVGDGNKDVVDAIKDYESWADKIADCQQELAELKTAIRQLELQKFNSIMEDFTNQFDLRENGKDLISKQIDLLKEAGELIGESFFTAQIDQSKKQLALLEEEKAQLVNQMSSALSSGRIQSGTSEFLEMVDAISDVEGSILDCKKSIESLDNELLQLHTEIFDRIQEQFSNLDSEISNIIGLFEDFDVANDKGIWSKEGLSQLGLLVQQYELAQYQIQQYNNEIDELNRLYLEGRYSAVEFSERLATLSEQQWQAVKSSEAAKDAIMDLNEARINLQIEGIEREIDAYKELTDAQIKALKAEKDLHDYEKSIAEKSKSIADLEKQLSALEYDTSQSAIAKKKLLQEQLQQQIEDLEEEQYQHSLETSEDALNKQLENFQNTRNDEIEALQESLNDKETLIADSFEAVKNNADLIGQEIASIALEHGITISNTLISSWQSGEKAIASYGEVLSQNTSTFIGNIMQVEQETWNLQAQANNTADTLAYMFSTRADNLVNELAQSYYAEDNLNAMTQALHDSLVNTLEGGYDISGITNALSSIANGLNSITAAANNASQALANMGTSDSKSIVPSIVTSAGAGAVSGGASGANNRRLGGGGGTQFQIDAKRYASGVRHLPNDEIAITQEDGTEIILSPVRGGLLLPKEAFLNREGAVTDLKKGDTVLTSEQTDNMFKWAQFNPDDFMKGLNVSQTLPNIESKPVNNTIQIDNILTVQGSIDNGNVKRMERVAQRAINDAFGRFAHDVNH